MEKKRRVTLKDVASVCGYTVNTVSRALRGDTRLPEETRKLICDAAQSLGYIRNSVASSLRSGHSNIIAMVVDDINNPHYSALISEVDRILRGYGYSLNIMCSQGEIEREKQIFEEVVSFGMDGLLLCPRGDSQLAETAIRNSHVPIVLITRDIADAEADMVRIDDYQGGYAAGKSLLEKGRRKLLYIAGPVANRSQEDRQRGLFQAMKEYGIGSEEIKIISHTRMTEAIEERRVTDLMRKQEADGIIAFNDDFAYRATRGLELIGKRVPEDTAVIGFDHIRGAYPYLPPLASVACEKGFSLAESAVRLLLARMQNPEKEIETEILPVSIYDEYMLTPGERKETDA